MPDRAQILIGADGRYVDANLAALDILGVSLDELRESEPGRFAVERAAPEEQEAFRDAWRASGEPEVAGQSRIRRGDGTTIAIRFLIHPQEDGTFLALLDRAQDAAQTATSLFTVGDVLAAWRAAERRLETMAADDPQLSSLHADIDRFRDQYRAIFDAKRRSY